MRTPKDGRIFSLNGRPQKQGWIATGRSIRRSRSLTQSEPLDRKHAYGRLSARMSPPVGATDDQRGHKPNTMKHGDAAVIRRPGPSSSVAWPLECSALAGLHTAREDRIEGGRFMMDGCDHGNGHTNGHHANRRTGAHNPPSSAPRCASPSSGGSCPRRKGRRRHRRPTNRSHGTEEVASR